MLRVSMLWPTFKYLSPSSSSSAFPAISLGFTILGEIFAYVTVFLFFFLNPIIEVVPFCLCRRCLLGVFLSLAFTHPGHERQDLLSPSDGMHVCRDKTSVYTLTEKSFREWSQSPCSLQGKNPLYQRLRGGSNQWCCIKQNSKPNTLPTELFCPPPPTPHPKFNVQTFLSFHRTKMWTNLFLLLSQWVQLSASITIVHSIKYLQRGVGVGGGGGMN